MPFEVSPAVNMLKQSKGKQDVNLTQGSAITCRICWGSEEDDDGKDFNPLISPCNCTGTVQAIHLKCLKEWLETKRTMKVHKG
jgi:E3 ubiquitin-protein ligase DOA10